MIIALLNRDSINFEEELTTLINLDKASTDKAEMKTSMGYYEGKHDILNYRIFYVNSNGQTVEEKNRSNIKIPHRFYTENIDQKVGYLLSNPVQFNTTNQELEQVLKQYIDNDLQQVIYDLVEGASIKGKEALYYFFDSKGKIQFDTVDSYTLVFLQDLDGETKQVIRYFLTTEFDGKNHVQKEKAELYDEKQVTYLVKEGKKYVLDKAREMNPKPHKMIKIGDDLFQPKQGSLPFLVLQNNKRGTTDLPAIKDLIDDYDLHSSALTNQLEDFAYPVYMVKGYNGDDLDDFITNIKARQRVGVEDGGDFDLKTVDIPFEARKTKLEITKDSIYKFGMSFNTDKISSQSGNTLTNVGIRATFSLLDIKVNRLETRLKKVLEQMLELILENIKELTGQSFDVSEIDIEITRTQITNDKEIAEQENILSQAHLNRINAIITSSVVLDSIQVAELLAKELGIEVEEAASILQSEDRIQSLLSGEAIG